MLRYLAFRLLLVIPVLIGILVLTFLVTHVLPANPAVEAAGAFPTPSAIHAADVRLGLNHSIFVQLWKYTEQLLHGNLGTSTVSGSSVLTELTQRIPSTLELITLSMILAVTLGVGAAVLSASRDSGIRNVAGRAYGALGASIPDYCLALVLVLIFYAALHWLPAPLGQSGPSAPSIRSRTGAYLLDAILAGNPTAIWDGITHLIMPVAALGIVFGSPIYRVARPAIEQIQASPYIEYAEMMGAKPRAVRAYVMQNALPPIVTLIGIIYGLLLGGAVLVETIFGWGGVGQYALQSVEAGDYFAIQGFVLAAALFSVIVYLIVDIAHAALDPRVRQSMW